jgi:5-methylcytosine-specific restriction protein A
MPNRAPRGCLEWPCPNDAGPSGRCAAHAQKAQKTYASERGKTGERGYDYTWQRLRKMKLAANPICEIQTHCKGLVPDCAATEVHHVQSVKERPDLRLVWENLKSICRPCHNAITRAENPQDNSQYDL